MVGYDEYEKGYNLFYPSYQNTFIERSVQFEAELMEETKFAKGECSHPPLEDDVSDEIISDIYDFNMDKYYVTEHDFPSLPMWAEKTREVAGDLASNPLDPRTTRS